MRIARVMLIALLASACRAHRAADVRCDGPLVPINSGGFPATTPVAQSDRAPQQEAAIAHGE